MDSYLLSDLPRSLVHIHAGLVCHNRTVIEHNTVFVTSTLGNPVNASAAPFHHSCGSPQVATWHSRWESHKINPDLHGVCASITHLRALQLFVVVEGAVSYAPVIATWCAAALLCAAVAAAVVALAHWWRAEVRGARMWENDRS